MTKKKRKKKRPKGPFFSWTIPRMAQLCRDYIPSTWYNVSHPLGRGKTFLRDGYRPYRTTLLKWHQKHQLKGSVQIQLEYS